jgi:hypothetical protein
MRRALCLLLATCTLASANPRLVLSNPVTSWTYIWQEHLDITVSDSEAVLKGTFRFRYAGTPQAAQQLIGVTLFVPVWFPEQNPSDHRVAAFWRAFRRDEMNHITPASSAAVEDALGLRVAIGESPQSISDFAVLTTNLWKGWYTNEWRVFQAVQEPGFCCLVFEFLRAADLLRKQLPMTITHRQPLLQAPGGRVFFYCPVFDHLPARISTLNTNDYAITIKAAAGCSLNGMMGKSTFSLDSGQSVTVSPQHHTPILIVSVKKG